MLDSGLFDGSVQEVIGHKDLQGLVSHQLLQAGILYPELLNFTLRGIPETVSLETSFPSLHEVLEPGIIQGRGKAFPPTKIRNRDLLAESFQNNPNLVFS